MGNESTLNTVNIFQNPSHCPVTLSLDAFQSINGTQEGKFQLCEWKNTSGCVAFSFFRFQVHMPAVCNSTEVIKRVSLHNEVQVVPLWNYRNPVFCKNTPKMQSIK